MAVNRVEIKDFLVFKGDFAMDFCPGVNVLIGSNGTGKTTLLRTLYGGCKWRPYITDTSYNKPLEYMFGVDSFNQTGGTVDITLSDGFILKFIIDSEGKRNYPDNDKQVKSIVYIPEKDMLEHSRGLPETVERSKGEMSFNNSHLDIIQKARAVSQGYNEPLVKEINSVIGGEIYCDGVNFYMKRGDSKVSFSQEASAYKKFALLARLLDNGSIEPGSVLFWDEPENSLNPELVPVLVDILLELSRNGVQVFIATHSKILSEYFAVSRQKGDTVFFYSLYKEGEQIKYDKDDRFDLLVPNNLTSEPVRLYEKQIEKGLGGNE
ncbi:MAG: AAA family ATPase [Gracilibacteraceae bacterium]|jgi:ABC-type hemin transport system ATPase subunit|nr:AAA family ATPase [Gracilibacteraceae bacterium]